MAKRSATAPCAASQARSMAACTRPTSRPRRRCRSEADAMHAEPSLIEYPSAFPIKVMGAAVEGFEQAVIAVARAFDPAFEAATIERRPSKAGNYLGLTITV